MKPDIATALIFSAQEISTRFLPLLKEEYDQSRLGSWGGLMLIASLQLDSAADNLDKENKQIILWFKSKITSLNNSDLIQRLQEAISIKLLDIKISTLDGHNQLLRSLLVEVQEQFEIQKDDVSLKESWVILREMHGHRKISPLLSMLQNKS
jgi:hypothetical protein|tara:strand:+ start:2261 stop:2716 length:456 start_codon:yes stop_codon:yes gene_type:complete